MAWMPDQVGHDKCDSHPRALKSVTLGLPTLSPSGLTRGSMGSMVQPWNDRYKCHPRTLKSVTLGLSSLSPSGSQVRHPRTLKSVTLGLDPRVQAVPVRPAQSGPVIRWCPAHVGPAQSGSPAGRTLLPAPASGRFQNRRCADACPGV